MPAATTHVLFAQDVYRHLSDDKKKEITSMPMFLLGSQGPDLLFFSGASFLPGTLKPLGNRMHDEKQNQFIPFFDQYSDGDPALRSYFYGFLCHYALDSLEHPLICAQARRMSDETGEDEGVLHVTMEGEIDVWMLHQRGRTIASYDVFNQMKVSKEERRKLAEMYHAMFLEVFHQNVPARRFAAACIETPLCTRILYPNEKKYNLIYHAEDLLKMGHGFSGMMLCHKGDPTILNLEKRALPLTFDSERTIQASFPELYGKAIFLARHLINERHMEDYVLNFCGEPVH